MAQLPRGEADPLADGIKVFLHALDLADHVGEQRPSPVGKKLVLRPEDDVVHWRRRQEASHHRLRIAFERARTPIYERAIGYKPVKWVSNESEFQILFEGVPVHQGP